MESSETIAAYVFSCLDETPSHSIRGVSLSALVKHRFPDFTAAKYNCYNLRDFIRKNVKGVIEIDRAGMDVVYGLADAQTKTGVLEPPPILTDTPHRPATPTAVGSVERGIVGLIDFEVARAFRSPNAFLDILGNTLTGELKVVPRGTVAETPWVRIPRCSPETHLKIAKDFIATIQNETCRMALTRVLDDSHNWWLKFWEFAGEFGLSEQWSAFRKRKLAEELDATLRKHGIPISSESISTATHDLGIQRRQLQPKLPDADDETTMRRLAIKVIGNLPMEELRSLRFPLGDIIDALKSS
ncbi:MAG: hypothetical protein A3H28_00820 [Acidobacteria bacterium RIFCSPLOWO2_02_FULL_61_28]|nr:MAG: hypothetical protein A3H28_00820 [Acidobacteria bacterium RIFCSPLOWO2_02_FULL_61_28]